MWLVANSKRILHLNVIHVRSVANNVMQSEGNVRSLEPLRAIHHTYKRDRHFISKFVLLEQLIFFRNNRLTFSRDYSMLAA